MKATVKKLLCALLAVCLLLTANVTAFAAGDSDDPNVYVSKGVYVADEWVDTDTVVTFDPGSGRLTIDDRGNAVPIADEYGFYEWIKSVAPGVKTVYLPADAELANFSMDEEGEAYASGVWFKAFAYLDCLERFEVDKNNFEFEVKDGVLYRRHCYWLYHYPAAKPDKTYKIDGWCMYGLEPYAFCNTKYLERLEIPYSRTGNANYFFFDDYSVSALDLDTGEPAESSIKQIAFYGTENEIKGLAAEWEGNNAVEQAEIDELPTSVLKDLLVYLKIGVLMTIKSMFDMFHYL